MENKIRQTRKILRRSPVGTFARFNVDLGHRSLVYLMANEPAFGRQRLMPGHRPSGADRLHPRVRHLCRLSQRSAVAGLCRSADGAWCRHTGVGYAGTAMLPNGDLLGQAAGILNAGKKVATLVGAGALGATNEVIAIAHRLQAGVATALLAWKVFSLIARLLRSATPLPESKKYTGRNVLSESFRTGHELFDHMGRGFDVVRRAADPKPCQAA